MSRPVFSSLIAMVLCVLTSVSAETYTAGSAADVMRSVVTTYQELSTYQDRGRSVQTSMLLEGEKEASRNIIQFTTLFKRCGRYRFVWTSRDNFFGKEEESSSNRFWSDGSKGWYSESSYSGKPRVSEMSFRDASAAATGISQGTSHAIFRLLSNEVSGFRYDQLWDLRITGSEVVSGVDSNVVRGNYSDGSSLDLWIGKRDHLIRKGVHTWLDGTTTTFERSDIVVNVDIPDSEFRE